MSNRFEGKSCPVCHSYLFEEDDIVVCPVCGAPHHRDCYEAVGHCALQDDHGTDRQYDRAAEAESEKTEGGAEHICPNCGKSSLENTVFCPFCGYPMDGVDYTRHPFGVGMGFGAFMPDPYGGVDKNADLGGITAEQARRFVAVNTGFYIPKFLRLSPAGRASWNWAAFLLPHGWLLYRKQYKLGIFAAVLMLLASALSIPLSISMNNIAASLPVDSNSWDIMNAMILNGGVGLPQSIAAFAGFLITMGIRIFFGINGNYLYKKHTIVTVKDIMGSDMYEEEELYRTRGGVNPWLMLLAFLATAYLPMLITSFFV